MRRLWLRLTGGRPMVCIRTQYFYDTVQCRPVGLYLDLFGREWMAFSRWSWFRVRRADTAEGD